MTSIGEGIPRPGTAAARGKLDFGAEFEAARRPRLISAAVQNGKRNIQIAKKPIYIRFAITQKGA